MDINTIPKFLTIYLVIFYSVLLFLGISIDKEKKSCIIISIIFLMDLAFILFRFLLYIGNFNIYTF